MGRKCKHDCMNNLAFDCTFLSFWFFDFLLANLNNVWLTSWCHMYSFVTEVRFCHVTSFESYTGFETVCNGFATVWNVTWRRFKIKLTNHKALKVANQKAC